MGSKSAAKVEKKSSKKVEKVEKAAAPAKVCFITVVARGDWLGWSHDRKKFFIETSKQASRPS